MHDSNVTDLNLTSHFKKKKIASRLKLVLNHQTVFKQSEITTTVNLYGRLPGKSLFLIAE